MEKISQELKIVEIRDFTKFVKKKKSDEGENKEFRTVSFKDNGGNFSLTITDESSEHCLGYLRRKIDVNEPATLTLVVKAGSQKTLDDV